MENSTGKREQQKLLNSILDDSNQMIQVSDTETFTMLYANKPARCYTGHADMPYAGEHCYEYMMGLKEQCPFCPMRQMQGKEYAETEIDNGQQIFAVKTKITELDGREVFIEYAWDITEIRRSEKIFASQMETLIRSIPDAQGIMHMDVTEDRCLNLNGNSRNMDSFVRAGTVDETIRKMASFAPTKQQQEEIFRTFCRDALIHAYENGSVQLAKETDSYFDDGSVRSARVTARLIVNPATDHLECVVYGMDISEEKQEKRKYERHMGEQLAIFDTLSRDFRNIFLVDAGNRTVRILKLDGYVTTGLDKTKDISYPYEATCRQYIYERVHPEDQDKMTEAMRLEKVLQVLSEKTEYVETYQTISHGEKHYYRFKYMRLEGTEQIIAGFQCIDEIIASEKEQQRKLTEALERAELASHAKTDFLNNISHEIRTPLNAILGFASLAKLHVQDSSQVEEYLDKVTTSGKHLLLLINDVLDMSHIESGKIQLQREPLFLPSFFENICMIIQPEMDAKQLHFSFRQQALIHQTILADALRLNQIMINILGNSVKYTAPGGNIIFEVEEKEAPQPEYAAYRFRIKDDGIGIGEKFQEHIFEAFTREQTSTHTGIKGTGLGMSITKKLVDMMGGSIAVESEVQKGTTFTVEISFPLGDPVEAGQDPKEDIAEYLTEQAQEVSGKTHVKRRILLAEDNELNQEIAVELLKEAGFEVEVAENGAVALQKLIEGTADTYDLILMDIQMPHMDGYEATRRIRQLSDRKLAEIPVFAMTANAFEEDRKKAMDAGMDGYLAKPIDVRKLIQTIREVLTHKQL